MDADKIAHDIAMLHLSRKYDEIKSSNKELFMVTTDYIGLSNMLASEYMAFYWEAIGIIKAKQNL